MSDVKGLLRVVNGYSKQSNEDGEYPIQVSYKLKPISLSFLQKLFGIDTDDPDPGIVDLIDCYPINRNQAEVLQSYVIDGVIDVDKYDFMLECYSE